MSDDERIIEHLEVDLEIADIGELLEAHGISPTRELVIALWDWHESKRSHAD